MTVEPAVVVADRAALLRPLLEHEQGFEQVLVLTLSDNRTDLAVLAVPSRELTSVGQPFPHEHPGEGSGVQARDAGSRQRDARHHNFWRRVANDAHAQIQRRDLPVVTVGVERTQAFLREVSAWPRELALPVVSSPDSLSEAELIDRVIAAAHGEHERRFREVTALVAERTDQGRVATGMTDLYQAAVAGRVELLLVAPGTAVPGYLTPTGHLVADDPGDGTLVPDAYAEGMAEVVLRGGRVVLGPAERVAEPRATLRW